MKTNKIITLVFIIILTNYKLSYGQFTVLTGGVTNQVSPGAITVNGLYIGQRTHATNTAVGSSALLSNTISGTNNAAFGVNALASNVTGSLNVSVGTNALQYSLGNDNAFLGFGSGQGGTTAGADHTGSRNSGFGGGGVLYSLLGANGNCSFGYASLHSNASSDSNVAVGTNSLVYLTGGGANVAVGYNSLYFLGSGRFNVAIGNTALANLASGNNNVGIGSGASLANGNDQLSIQNVIYGTNMNSTSTGNIGLGVSAPSQQFHTTRGVRFQGLTISPGGASAVTRLVGADASGVLWQSPLPVTCGMVNYIPKTSNANGDMTCSQIFDNGMSVGIAQTGSFGYATGATLSIGSPTPPANFKLAVNGWTSSIAFVALSDQRLKKDIKKIKDPLGKISKISGYTYYWNKDYKTDKKLDDNKQAGFLAQEILKVLPEAVIKSDDGIYGLNYNAIMPLLAEGIKEQQSQIEEQQVTIANLEAKVEELSNKFNQLVPSNVKMGEEYFQVTPNPVTKTSTVTYKLQNNIRNPLFVIYDIQGKLLKQLNIPPTTKTGQIQIGKNEFRNGMYILALISNNTEIQAKRFLVTD